MNVIPALNLLTPTITPASHDVPLSVSYTLISWSSLREGFYAIFDSSNIGSLLCMCETKENSCSNTKRSNTSIEALSVHVSPVICAWYRREEWWSYREPGIVQGE
jgi:hypothetical protein